MPDAQVPPGRMTYEEWVKTKKYAKVTTVSSFYHTYMVPLDKLQELNPEAPVDPNWLAESVIMNEVEEFSQLHVGENILDVEVVNEDEMLIEFDKKNDYLKDWTKERKIKWVRKSLRGPLE